MAWGDEQQELNEYIKHHGVKGMKWGVRRANAYVTKSSKRVDNIKTKVKEAQTKQDKDKYNKKLELAKAELLIAKNEEKEILAKQEATDLSGGVGAYKQSRRIGAKAIRKARKYEDKAFENSNDGSRRAAKKVAKLSAKGSEYRRIAEASIQEGANNENVKVYRQDIRSAMKAGVKNAVLNRDLKKHTNANAFSKTAKDEYDEAVMLIKKTRQRNAKAAAKAKRRAEIDYYSD